MASKASGNRKTVAKGLTTTFVKKANMWVATYPKDGKNVQEWFMQEPTAEQLTKIRELMV